jgi:hypothetical protein
MEPIRISMKIWELGVFTLVFFVIFFAVRCHP